VSSRQRDRRAPSRELAHFAPAPALAVLLLACLCAFVAALCIGSVAIDPGTLLSSMTGMSLGTGADAGQSALASTLLALRLPRAVTAMAVGGLLGLSGALLQSLLRNGLADPYVLGISGGASCAALAAIALGLGAGSIAACSAVGAFCALFALFVLARRELFARDAALDQGRDSAILLTGVMIASLCAAGMSLVLALAPDGRLRTMVFWLLGDLAGAVHLDIALGAMACWAILAAVAARDARALNLMLGGDLQAFTQGVATTRVRRRLIAITAIATGTAVSLAGAVGFVGFVAPHLARRALGADQRAMLPAASLLGAFLVTLADTLARSIAAPLQLPVGALTAIIGVPVFLWQLQRP
jgi:iron complex transport system permease protein